MPGARAGDGDLPGADIVADTAVIGQVLGLLRDPLSQRVTRLITRYGVGCGRQVAVPIEWIVRRGPRRLIGKPWRTRNGFFRRRGFRLKKVAIASPLLIFTGASMAGWAR